MNDRETNFALLAIVAIVAIVALIILLKAQSGPIEVDSQENDNLAGQMMKISGAKVCCLNGDGECEEKTSGACKTGSGCTGC